MTRDPERRVPTIDMTLDGDVVAPPSFWARMRAIWRALPAGTVPSLMAAAIVLACVAVFLLGVLLLAIPLLVGLGILGLVLRAGLGSGASPRPPARR